MAVGPQFLGAGARGHDQQVEAGSLQRRSDGGEQAQEERVIEVAGLGGQHETDRLAAATAQATGELVGPIADTFRFRQDAGARGGGDLGEAAEGARDRRDRQVEPFGNGAQRHPRRRSKTF